MTIYESTHRLARLSGTESQLYDIQPQRKHEPTPRILMVVCAARIEMHQEISQVSQDYLDCRTLQETTRCKERAHSYHVTHKLVQ